MNKKAMVKFGSLLAVMFFIILSLANNCNATDKLIVKDSAGANTVFDVTDSGQVTIAGFVGAGTSNPTGHLSVTDQATTFNRGGVFSQHTKDSAAPLLIFRKSRGTEASPAAVVGGDYPGAFSFVNYSGTNWLRNGNFGARVSSANITSTSVPTELYFATSATDDPDPFLDGTIRLLIDSTGNIGIGTTYPTHLLQLSGGAYSDGATWVNASSRELKENIDTLSSESALKALDGLTPVTFNYKTDHQDKHVGFIAEDVPDLVATKDRKGISALDIVAVVTKVVKEQKEMLEAQQKVIGELSMKLKTLESQMRRMKGIELMGSVAQPVQ